jgi:hypothetical protein
MDPETPGAPGERPWDRPTETMPAVQAPDARATAPDGFASEAGSPAVPMAPTMPDEVSLAPPLPAPPAATQAQPPYSPPARAGRRAMLVGGGVGAVVGLGLALALAALGAFDGLAGTATSPTPARAGAANSPSASHVGAPAGSDAEISVSCESQQVAAPAAGGWILQRANYSTRQQRDTFVALLRRDGDTGEPATVSAALVGPAEVPARFGVDAPAGAETVLVLTFDGPVRVAGPFGDRPGYRTLERFEVVRDGSGKVHALLALRSHGCFSLAAPEWQAGQMNGTTQVTVEIENR